MHFSFRKKKEKRIISGEVISDEAAEYLRVSAYWSRYLSIVGFVVFALILLSTVGGLIYLYREDRSALTDLFHRHSNGVFRWEYILAYLVFIIAYYVPLYYLYQYSVKSLKALKTGDSKLLTAAFKALKNHFWIIGILLSTGFLFFKIATAFIALRIAGMK